ncbi:MAG: hypothetical protein M3R61_00410 [Chloroflexota bacterium]|nr:hypothetical protein [Chloroflexota bacterium]
MRQLAVEGTVRQQGFTVYQYGSHVLVDSSEETLYAMRADQIDLDSFVGQRVRVSGSLIPGYPVDAGPKYLAVSSVQPVAH